MSEYKIGKSARSMLDKRTAIEAASHVTLWLGDDPTVYVEHVSEMAYALALGRPVIVGGDALIEDWPLRILYNTITTFWQLDEEAKFTELVDTVVNHMVGERIHGSPQAFYWLSLFAKCESPIETRLCLHLLNTLDYQHHVEAQRAVDIGGKRYRLDFAIVEDGRIPDCGAPFHLGIECDGHEWHERTKQQATRDKARDRALVSAGWRVLRFTGSEVWNHPHECALEVLNVANSLSDGEQQQ